MSTSPDLSGKMLGQYELRQRIGVGGMAAVYRAHQPRLRRDIAIKILPEALANEPGYLQRFEREAETAASLEHPHIVPVYDYGTEHGITFVAMRLLAGGSLSERVQDTLQTDGQLPSLAEIAQLLRQVGGALDYAHERGVVHRDIKPSNIMFDEQGNPFVVDFGIAKLLNSTSGLTGTGQTMGTPNFMAPEQWMAKSPTAATDQYAVGVMAYSLITGNTPFEAPTPFGLMNKHLNEIPRAPSLVRPDLPPRVNDVISRAMAKKPEERYPSLLALADEFEAAVADEGRERTSFFTFQVKERNFGTEQLPDAPNTNPTPDPLRDGPTVTPASGAYTPAPSTAPPPTGTPLPQNAGPVRDSGSGRNLPLVLVAVVVLLALGAGAVFVFTSGGDGDDNGDNGDTAALSAADEASTATAAFNATELVDTITRTPIDLLTPTPAPTRTPTQTPGPSFSFEITNQGACSQVDIALSSEDDSISVTFRIGAFGFATRQLDADQTWDLLITVSDPEGDPPNPDCNFTLQDTFAMSANSDKIVTVPDPDAPPTATPTEAAAVDTTDATDEPTDEPTATNEPTLTPTDEPTDAPTLTPTDEPTATFTHTATAEPTMTPSNTPTDAPTPTEVAATVNATVLAGGDAAPVRAAPGIGANILTYLPNGTVVEVVERVQVSVGDATSLWLGIELDGDDNVGYINAGLLAGFDDGSLTLLPETTQPGVPAQFESNPAAVSATAFSGQFDINILPIVMENGTPTDAWDVDFNAAGNAAIVGGANDNAYIVRLGEGAGILRILTGHTEDVSRVAWARNADVVATGSEDGEIRIWRPSDGTLLQTMPTPTDADVFGLAFGLDDRLLAASYADGMVRLFDVRSGAELNAFTAHEGIAWAVRFTPDGQQVVSGGQDGRLAFWDITTGRETNALVLPNNQTLTNFRYSADGSILAVGTVGGDVIVFDSETLFAMQFVNAATSEVWSLDLSHDGSVVAVAAGPGQIAFYNNMTGGLLGVEEIGVGAQAWSVRVSPDGRFFAATDDNGRLLVIRPQ